MNKYNVHIYIILLSLGLLFGCMGKKKVYIKGNITSLPDRMVYMSVYENSLRIIDSTQSVDGKFTLTLPEILPNIVFLNFETSPDNYIPVMVEGKDVSISGNYNYNDEIRVYGTPANDILEEYRKSVRRHKIMLEAINITIGEYSDSMQMADSLEYATLISKRDSIRTLVNTSQRQLIKQHPSSIVSALFIFQKADGVKNASQIDSLLNQLDVDNMPDNAFLRRLYRLRDELQK